MITFLHIHDLQHIHVILVKMMETFSESYFTDLVLISLHFILFAAYNGLLFFVI